MNRETVEDAGLIRASDRFRPLELRRIWGRAIRYWPLYLLVFPICLFLISLWYVRETPTYTAAAIIGPPGPSPMMNMLSGGGSAFGLVSRALGSSNSAGHDPYADYLQLLHSSRLSLALMEHDEIVKQMFANRWDSQNNRWLEPPLLGRLSLQLKRYLHRPVSIEPGVDDVAFYLTTHLRMDYADSGPSLSIFPTTTPFVRVTLIHDYDPQVAERILSVILSEADRLIRDDQRRNITGRISYLRGRLSQQAITGEERTALISVLSNQEQLLTMIQADQRYAATLLVSPHASINPTWPPRVRSVVLALLVGSVMIWFVLVMLVTWIVDAWRGAARFEGGRHARPFASAAE